MMRMRALKPYRPVDFPGLDFVTPLPIKHAVPTMSFYLRGAKSDFLFVSDFWQRFARVLGFRSAATAAAADDDRSVVS